MSDNGDGIERDVILSHLERVLSSAPFRQTERSAGLLRYLVERSLTGTGDRLKEYTVGVEFLGRGTEFDPRTDPIVRAEASRLRGRLERYYADEGQSDAVVIELPKGAYAVRFHARSTPVAAPTSIEEQPGRRRRSYRSLMLAGLIGVTVIAGLFGASAWRARSSPTSLDSSLHLEPQLQTDELIASDVETDVVVAPDGSGAAFVSIDSLGVRHLRVLPFDGSPLIDLPGTAGARGPFWSPDSRSIGFWAARQIRKIAVGGGPPVFLCDADDLLGASWFDDRTIIASLGAKNRLWRIDASSGGKPVAVVDLTARKADPRWPQVLPGGKYVLYTAFTGVDVDRANIEVAPLDGGQPRVLVKGGGTFGRFVAPNHLTYVNQGTLNAQRFDPHRFETYAPAIPIFNDVAYSTTFGFAQISFADNGLTLYRRASSSGPLIVVRVDSTGQRTPLLGNPGLLGWPSLSPDGQRLAVSVVESGVQGVSLFTDLGKHPRLLRRVSRVDSPVWTRDGQHLVARGDSGIISLSASGENQQTLIETSNIYVPWTFGPDDRHLAFAAWDTTGGSELRIAPVEKTGGALRAGTPTRIVRSRYLKAYPAISPDERWLAYGSDESGSGEVYVRSLSDSGTGSLVSAGGVPRWSRVGQRLFFTTADRRIMVVDYKIVGGKFVAGTPRRWTSIRLGDTGVLSGYDLGPSDKYIVALVPEHELDPQAANRIAFIRDVRSELDKAPKR